MKKYHVFLETHIGIENLSSEQLEAFEYIIGSLNETLEPMYGCTICYDCDGDTGLFDPETGELNARVADKNITVNGFEIHVFEKD